VAARPVRPDLRDLTLRHALRDALVEGPATARDLSRIVGIPERSVAEHLAHLERSLRHEGKRIEVAAPACLDCEFVFVHRDRHRYSRPGRCPRCHGRRITLPRFWIGER
jgi:predicted Zn-ribbon and HTH transcriptional regulator